MGHECFQVEISDKVALVTMNRPERSNSMIPSFWSELPQIVDELSAGGQVRAMVLAAQGKNFNSGMDLSVFGAGQSDGPAADGAPAPTASRRRERTRSLVLKLQDSFTALERARMPVLCAIQGACVGGGIDMVSAADMRYATESAWFSIHEINIGMTADVGTLQRMPKLIPEGVVRELAFTGRRWTAAEAHAAGFVNQVFETHQVMLDAVLDVAGQIADKSPMAVWGTKSAMNFSRDHGVAEGLEYIANWNSAMLDPADMAEAFTADQEKRQPEFPDLFPLSDGLA